MTIVNTVSNAPVADLNLPIVNIAAYKFVALENLAIRRESLRELCASQMLMGTILLTPEGINLFIAGDRTGIDALLVELRKDPALCDLEVKESYSAEQPFSRMLVKIKSEIIAFGQAGIEPADYTSKKIAPKDLKAWLDDGKEVVLLDVRNDYEIGVGTFENAVPVKVDHFRDFPEAIENLPEEMKSKPIVMFCTGGIRCEKAGPFMERAGFDNVYQLGGGILKYFEDIGGDHYQGECFVFDKRVALAPNLLETETKQCYACLVPLSVEDQQSPHYSPPHSCPHCYISVEEQRQLLLQKRHEALRKAVSPLPGSIAYENVRPLNVQGRFDGLSLLDFLTQYHPHLGEEYWKEAVANGRIHQHHRPVSATRIVRGGEQFAHLHPADTEPDVNADIRILFEDDAIVVVNKPAPLPMHPSGRFNRNSLQWILNQVYAPLKLRPAHRLDANTSGIAVFCKSRFVSQNLQPQFEHQSVQKEYRVRVVGDVDWQTFQCNAPISREPNEFGGRAIDASDVGLESRTDFEKVAKLSDGTTLLKVFPKTGRTNQIRVHLWEMGIPVWNDPLYLPDGKLGEMQTQPTGQVMGLFARALTFKHPLTHSSVTFEAPLPDWAQEES